VAADGFARGDRRVALASDASHFAPAITLTVDGLGPRGGAAHNPDEHVLVDSVQPRAEVALAVTLAALGD
jgi:glutamate carboxypeptidase